MCRTASTGRSNGFLAQFALAWLLAPRAQLMEFQRQPVAITGHGVRDPTLFGGVALFVGCRFIGIGGSMPSNIARLSPGTPAPIRNSIPRRDGDVIALAMAAGARPVVAGDSAAFGGEERRSQAIFPSDDTIFTDGSG